MVDSDSTISSGMIRSTCPSGKSVGAGLVRGVTARTRPSTSITPVGNAAKTGLSVAEFADGVQPRLIITIVPSVSSSGVITQRPELDSKLCLRTSTCACVSQVPVSSTVRQVDCSVKRSGSVSI